MSPEFVQGFETRMYGRGEDGLYHLLRTEYHREDATQDLRQFLATNAPARAEIAKTESIELLIFTRPALIKMESVKETLL